MSVKGNSMPLNRPRENETTNGSVIYSFYQKWEDPLRAGKVGVFFRKRFPSRKPDRVYFYIGAPVMAIIGSAFVDKVERVSKEKALSLAGVGCISLVELEKYMVDRDNVGAIHLSDFAFFEKQVPLSILSAEICLLPPQNFQKISREEQALIERLADHA